MGIFFKSSSCLYSSTERDLRKSFNCCTYVQKLEKVDVGLQEEQKIRNDLKGRYAAAVGERKRCYYLSKAFQVSFSYSSYDTAFLGYFCVLHSIKQIIG